MLVRFEYPTLSGPGSRGRLLIQHGDAERSARSTRVGEEELVVVVSDPVAFARWHLGEVEWDDALRSGAITVTGSSTLVRALPTWNRRIQPGHHSASDARDRPLSSAPDRRRLAVRGQLGDCLAHLRGVFEPVTPETCGHDEPAARSSTNSPVGRRGGGAS